MSDNHSGSCFGRFFLIALVPLLFVLFLGVNFFGVVNFVNISMHSFYIILAIFVIFLIFIPHNAFISICKIKSQFNITRNELEKNLEKTALTIEDKTKSVISVRDFLEDYFKNIRNGNFVKIASSTFPMLGILGTFIAIAISMPDFTVSNPKELDLEISKLLSGVGTAFYASIYGIFLSLWWTFFERLGLSSIERLTLSLEDIYSKYIWSQKELLKFKYNQKAIRDNELIKSLKETFNIGFIKDLNREHLESYEKIIDSTKKGLGEIENSLICTSNRLMKNIQEINIANNVIESKKILESNLCEFNNSAKELQKLLESFDTSLDSSLNKIDKELAEAVKHITNMVESVKELKK